MRLGLEHHYAALPAGFYAHSAPAPVADPRLVLFNAGLAAELGLDSSALLPQAAAVFSGNMLPEDAVPLAMAYAGHQFGHFNSQLGDGRAILLGELRDREGNLRDVQLKGAGRTRFSRDGDGRAVLGPMLREYLISEAMHALGIPSTRSLAVVATGTPVRRATLLPGAVLTRVASSHVRVGTFQYFAARTDHESLRHLLDYVIARHYPEARAAQSPALAVLESVAVRQASLIARWMQVGFIHGVMNTDNMAISGETIDYGPCAFLDRYDPGTAFSSIDHHGRYAYANQPGIAQWNLARFAETLLPLLHSDADEALRLASEVVQGFMPQFDVEFLAGMRGKLGLTTGQPGDAELVRRLFAALQTSGADFTLVFRQLCGVTEPGCSTTPVRELLAGASDSDAWLAQWRERLAHEPLAPGARAAAMRSVNPAYIPRNHRVEEALLAATEHDDLAPFTKLLAILQHPCDDQPGNESYRLPPEQPDPDYRTFCGT